MHPALALCAFLAATNFVPSQTTKLTWIPTPDSDGGSSSVDRQLVNTFDSAFKSGLPQERTVQATTAYLETWLPKAPNEDALTRLLGHFDCRVGGVACLDAANQRELRAWLVRTFRTESRQSLRDAFASSGIMSDEFRLFGNGDISFSRVRPGDKIGFRRTSWSRESASVPASVSFEIGRIEFHDSETTQIVVLDTLKAFPDDAQAGSWSLEDTLPGPGLYRLTLLGDRAFQDAFVNQSWIDGSVLRSGRKLLVYGASFLPSQTGPFGVTVHFPDGTRQKLQTDSSGVAVLELARDYRGSDLAIVLESQGSLGFVHDPYLEKNAFDGQPFVWTDRPVYRAGDLVHLRGTILDRDSHGKLRRSTLDSVAVKVEDFQRTRVVAMDRSRQFSDTIRIPRSQKAGIVKACASSRENRQYFDQEQCVKWLVEEYRKPFFEVLVNPRREATVQGDSAVVEIQARTFHGSPVVGGIAKLAWPSKPRRQYSMFDDQSPEPMEERTVSLDARGKARVKIPTIEKDEEWDLPVRIAVTDPSNRVEEATASLPIWTSRLRAEVEFVPRRPGVGDSTKAVVLLRDKSFQPVGGWIQFRQVVSQNVVLDTLIRVAPTGICTLEILPRAAQHQRLELASSTSSMAPWSVQSVDVPYPHDRGEVQIDLGMGEAVVHPGDSIRMVVRNLRPGQSALATVERGEILQYKGLRADRSGVARWTIPVNEDCLPKILVNVQYADRNQMSQRSETVFVVDSAANSGLSMELPAHGAPGAMLTVRVRLRDGKGRPIGGRFSLAVTDDAIWNVASDAALGWVIPDVGLVESIRRLGKLGVPQNSPMFSFNQPFLEILRRRLRSRSELELRSAKGFSGQSVIGVPVQGFEFDELLELAPRQTNEGDAMYALMEGSGGGSAFEVRRVLKDLAFWSDSVVVGKDGSAVVKFKLPDDATRWRFVLRGLDDSTNFHERTSFVESRKPLLVEIHSPRFLTETDSARIGATIRNSGSAAQDAVVSFEALTREGRKLSSSEKVVVVAGESALTLDWPISVPATDSVIAVVRATTNGLADGLAIAIPVRRHTAPQSSSRQGRIDSTQGRSVVSIELPPSAARGSGRWRVWASGGTLPNLVEPLKYLAEFPYDCVEQTLSRFLPRLQYASVARRAGIPNDSLEGILDAADSAGIERLERMKGSQSGWGWWTGATPDPKLTVLVLEGLQRMRQELAERSTGASKRQWEAVERMLRSGREPLQEIARKPENHPALRLQALKVLAGEGMGVKADDLRKDLAEIWKGRDSLGTVSLAFALESSHRIGWAELENEVVDRIEKRSIQDKPVVGSVAMCHWPKDSSWGWAGDSVESSALVLAALVRTGNGAALAKPGSAWLLSRVQSGRWGSTRATARALDAILATLESTRETPSRGTLKVYSGNQILSNLVIDGSKRDLAQANREFPDAQVKDGLRMEFQGKGGIQWAVSRSWTDTSRWLAERSGALSVKRLYKKIQRTADRKGVVKETMLPFGGTLQVGEELEVTLELASKVQEEHLMLEDRFPAGMVVSRSGIDPLRPWNTWMTYGESGLDRMTWFQSQVRPEVVQYTYRLRAERPGTYHALPARAELMYCPEIQANSDESIVRIEGR